MFSWAFSGPRDLGGIYKVGNVNGTEYAGPQLGFDCFVLHYKTQFGFAVCRVQGANDQ